MPDTKIKIASFQVIDHGPEHGQFFQGCGTAYTNYDHVVTGSRCTQKEAYDDALEQIAMTHSNVDLTELEAYGKARYDDDKVPDSINDDESGEWNYYLSILYKLKD